MGIYYFAVDYSAKCVKKWAGQSRRSRMGCDIHLYIEQKQSDGTWAQVEIDERLIPDDRHYGVFGFLAGIRCYDYAAQFESRGIPDDSSISEKDLGADYGFTHAYLDEVLAAPWKEAELEECYFKIFCEYVLPRLCCSCGFCNDEEKRNIRIIMGFDN
jgi:hypothetical protein